MTDRLAAPVLVVTPTLGLSRFLPDALESVHRAGVAVQHVIVVPAEGADMVRRVCPQCRIVTEEQPSGIYGAIERGIASAKPWNWFTYLNDDDLLTPAFGSVANMHMREESDDTIGFGDVRWVDDRGESLGLMPVARRDDLFADLIAQGVSPLTQQGTLTSHSMYSRLAGFDTRYRLAADLDFWVRALLAGAHFRYYPTEVARWRIRSGQASQDHTLAKDELLSVARLLPGTPSKTTLRIARARHTIANFSRYVERYRAADSFRSASLFARAAGQDAGNTSSKGQP